MDGCYNSAEAPAEQLIHITRVYSRDHRPDLNQVMLDLMVEHQARIPVLMQPLSGNTSDAQDYAENDELRRRYWLQAHLIAQALDAPCQPVNKLMAPMLVNVVGS